MKIHDLSAQHIFPGKWYTTYERIPELVVTIPSARSTIVKKIKQFIIWLYKWSRVTFTELLSAVVKIPWHYHHFPWLSTTFAIFHDFQGLENGHPKFHDFPWPGGTLLEWPLDNPVNFRPCQRGIAHRVEELSVHFKSHISRVKMSLPTNQHPAFYKTEAIPVTQPTVSEHWKEQIHNSNLHKLWLKLVQLVENT